MAIKTYGGLASAVGRPGPVLERPVVRVQGLGFVGVAMAIAVADARDAAGQPCFNVVGVELPTPEGEAKVAAVNAGRMPMANSDARLHTALERAIGEGNLLATSDEAAYALGISERTLRRLGPRLPRVHDGGVVLYPVEGLRRWLQEQAEVEGHATDEAVREVLEGISR